MRLFLLLIFLPFLLVSKEYKFFGLEETMKFEAFSFKYLSDNGDWLVYGLQPDRGDGRAIVQSTRNETKYEIPRATSPSMSETANYIAFRVRPDLLESENDKKNKLNDSLFILNTANGDIRKISDITSFDMSNDGNWLYYFKKGDRDEEKKNGKSLYLKHLQSNSDIFISNTNDVAFDSTSSYLIYNTMSEKRDENGIFFRDLKSAFAPEIIIEKDTSYLYDEFSYNIDLNKLAYKRAKLDSNKKAYQYEICLYDFATKNTEVITKSNQYENWYIPKKNKLSWTDNGERLFYGIKPLSEYIPEEDEKDKKVKKEDIYDFNKILDDANLYMWHNDDNKIITQKRTEWNKEKDRTYLAVYHIAGKLNSKLADTTLPMVYETENKQYTIALDPNPYEKNITYEGWFYDLYFVDLFSGEKTLIEKKIYSSAYMSDFNPDVVYFHNKHWHHYNITSRENRNLTENLKVKFYDEEHDAPSPAPPYGAAGWLIDGSTFLAYNRTDVWEFNIQKGILLNLSQAAGAVTNSRYRIANIDRTNKYINHTKSVYLNIYSYEQKSNKLVHLIDVVNMKTIGDSLHWNFEIKAKYSNDIIVSRESYDVFPDLYITNDQFDTPKKLTNVHPEIPEYNWGYTEMIKYTNSKGDTLQGYVIKPYNFDPNKKYPLFVYFYEKFSDRRHQFVSPKILHRPIYPWYVSQGYCMFFPDIKFYDGQPGASGMDAVMAGCQKLIDDGFIDKDKIALHGHSWSGYQSAFFATQTDFFKAVVTGAPVSNMTSAYSGIRLGSGLARQFQYEQMQSRIGGTLVDSLSAYIANSPVFFADKMNTPMLIMFGDIDDAVPWQQGIELYLACRRFEKPCIMLQYENEPHHLKKYPNKLDYTIKMKQFFDHYVLGKPAEEWIKVGMEYKGKPQTMEVENIK